MRKIADGERYLKGWKKTQWQKYWTPEEEEGDPWVADRASIDAFEAQHGAGDPTPVNTERTDLTGATGRTDGGDPTGRSTVRSLEEMDNAEKPSERSAVPMLVTSRSTTRGTARQPSAR